MSQQINVRNSYQDSKLLNTIIQRFNFLSDENQVTYLLKNLGYKFVVWLAIFTLLWLLSSSLLQILGLALLAIMLSRVAIAVSWHFMTKEFISDLDSKAVFVTGCDSGFGNKLAQKLDKKGATVYAGCLFPDGEGAKELKKICSDRLIIVPLDVTRDDHVEAAVKTVSSTLGDKKLWAVVNNAGIGIPGEVEWTSVDICKKTLEVNTIGPYRVTKAFLPLLRKSQGRVVIVASVLGRFSTSGSGPYCMSKHGAVSLADSLRGEVTKWNVSVHTIEPWLYSTNITNEQQLVKYLRDNFDMLPENYKNDYGDGYIEDYQRAVIRTINVKRPECKVYEVVDALEHASIGKNPKIRYVPGLWGHFCTWIVRASPVELSDLVNYVLTPHNVRVYE